MSALSLRALVSKSYPSPEWAVFFEVSDSTGWASSRRADAIALGIWPSRGNTIVGFEFKEDRRDWLRELKNPAKAETIAAHCDEWWVVTGAEGVAKVEEMPGPWGLKVASKDRERLLIVKPCIPFEGRDKTSLRRSFAAAMLRKVTENTVPKSELTRMVQEAVEKDREVRRDERELKNAQDHVKRLEARIREFEAASGVKIDGWDSPTKIGEAVRSVLAVDVVARRHLANSLATAELATKTLRECVDNLPSLKVSA